MAISDKDIREVLAKRFEGIGDKRNAREIRAGRYICEEVSIALDAMRDLANKIEATQ